MTCGFSYLVSSVAYAKPYPMNILSDSGWNSIYMLQRSLEVMPNIDEELAEGFNEKVEILVLRSGEVRIFDKGFEVAFESLSDDILRSLYIFASTEFCYKLR